MAERRLDSTPDARLSTRGLAAARKAARMTPKIVGSKPHPFGGFGGPATIPRDIPFSATVEPRGLLLRENVFIENFETPTCRPKPPSIQWILRTGTRPNSGTTLFRVARVFSSEGTLNSDRCQCIHDVYCTKGGNMLENVRTFLRQVTELGLLLVALAVVLQILFGSAVPFVGGDVVGNITALVATLGQQGLVGLIALAVIVYLFQRRGAAGI